MSRAPRPNDVTLWARERREAAQRLPPHKRRAERRCLGCLRKFASTWIGNRMCPNCLDLKGGGAWVR